MSENAMMQDTAKMRAPFAPAHTAGPWVVFHADEDGPNDVLPAMRPGCIARDIESTADAHLIATAPEMLTALEATTKNLRALEDLYRRLDDPKMADLLKVNCEGNERTIAKALGQPAR